MEDIKLVAIDLDGTLLSDNRKISVPTVKMIKKLAQKDIKIILASARTPNSILPYYQELDLKTPMICLSGAYIGFSESQAIDKRPLSLHSYKKLIEILENEDLYLKVYGLNRLYVKEKSEATAKFSKNFNVPFEVMERTSLANVDREPFRIFLLHLTAALRDQYLQWIPSHFADFNVTREGDDGIEIVDAFASKGIALKKVCEMYAIDLKNVMAIGNERNDLSMLKESGTSIAMGNACDELKQIADKVTKDNENDGVAWILNQYFS